jgi:SAM-dependent methyltransferase
MYDALSENYDRFVNWENRLSSELPFILAQLEHSPKGSTNSHSILDAACGTGMHAIALAKQGFRVTGADLSGAMIEKARNNARLAGVEVSFEQAGFGQLFSSIRQQFSAILCLGNSLPHVLTSQALAAALLDFHRCLVPGGLLLIQNRNFDAVLTEQQRWMEPESDHDEQGEWIFLRFYDFLPEEKLRFNFITLHSEEYGRWKQVHHESLLWAQKARIYQNLLVDADFSSVQFYGSLEGGSYDKKQSGNLVITAQKSFS